MAHLAGFGCYLPSRELGNDVLAAEFGVDSQWIIDSCGIHTRRIAGPEESVAVMAARASAEALAGAGMAARDLGAIIVGTGTPDRQFPGVSAALQRTLDAPGIPAFDIHLASAGGLFALSVAREMCERCGPVLVVASERMSDVMARAPRAKETAILFGDGAGAVVVAPGSGPIEVLDARIQSDATYADDLSLAFGETLYMNGRTVILQAHRKLTESVNSLLQRNRLAVDDVNLWLFHQANLRLLNQVGKSLKIPPERVFVNVDRYGNTSSASLLIAAAEAHRESLFDAGFHAGLHSGHVVLAAFGSGMSWGSMLLAVH
jgi:3-oxoacyl-[acyl-carrier-protein] synthase-3